jgi:hypothetical protein
VRVSPIGYEGSSRPTNIHHGVVDRVAKGADVFPGSASSGANHGRFHKGDAQGWKNQDAADKKAEGQDAPMEPMRK